MRFFDETQIQKIREGYYSAVYFNRTKQIVLSEGNIKNVTMQVFQKNDNSIICGVDVVRELFKETTGYFRDNKWIDKSSDILLETLQDGESANAWETVMHIKGPYAYFAHLESIYLGILARLTKIATNAKAAVTAANGKPVLFFADRFDLFTNQELDGYAAKIAGVTGVATPAQAHLPGLKPSGTIPHALIALSNGNTVEAAKKFAQTFPNEPLIVLVDFENDCVKTALEVARQYKDKLWGVRLDTSEQLTDKSIFSENSEDSENQRLDESDIQKLRESEALNNRPSETSGALSFPSIPKNFRGVNPQLVKNVRTALNENGFNHVKIVVSGGFTKEKIEQFEKKQTPVDVYGVGSSLLKGNRDFTADIVEVEGKKIAKTGREFKPNKKLQVIDTK